MGAQGGAVRGDGEIVGADGLDTRLDATSGERLGGREVASGVVKAAEVVPAGSQRRGGPVRGSAR